MASSHHRLCGTAHGSGPVEKGDHPLPQALRGPRDLPVASPTQLTDRARSCRGRCLTIYRSINALAESFNGLYKAELIRHRGPWSGLDDVEYATLEYVDWFNRRRLHGELGMIPPAEFESIYYDQAAPASLAVSQ